jgi:hypothetical protein
MRAAREMRAVTTPGAVVHPSYGTPGMKSAAAPAAPVPVPALWLIVWLPPGDLHGGWVERVAGGVGAGHPGDD